MPTNTQRHTIDPNIHPAKNIAEMLFATDRTGRSRSALVNPPTTRADHPREICRSHSLVAPFDRIIGYDRDMQTAGRPYGSTHTTALVLSFRRGGSISTRPVDCFRHYARLRVYT